VSESTTPAGTRPAHRFRVGQRVSFTGSLIYGAPSSAAFTVTRLMPPVGNVFSYRIKGDADTYERMAEERQLTAAFV
jgi:hypothetical protein